MDIFRRARPLFVGLMIKSEIEAKLLEPGLTASDIVWSEAPETP